MVITALLVAGLGNETAVRRSVEAGDGTRDLLTSLTTFPVWSTNAFSKGSDLIGPLSLKIVLFLFSVFLGAGLAGRVGSSTAAFLAGWGTVMIAAALSGAVFWLVADATVYKGEFADEAGGIVPLAVGGLNGGVQFGLYTGWLVGLGLLITARAPRPEPEWIAAETGPPGQPDAPPATSTSYPTVYPPLPASGEWSGLTAPVRAVGAAPPPTPRPPAEQPRPAEEAPRPLWPRSLPSNKPGGGAYGTRGQHRRPNWTRWSSRDGDE